MLCTLHARTRHLRRGCMDYHVRRPCAATKPDASCTLRNNGLLQAGGPATATTLLLQPRPRSPNRGISLRHAVPSAAMAAEGAIRQSSLPAGASVTASPVTAIWHISPRTFSRWASSGSQTDWLAMAQKNTTPRIRPCFTDRKPASQDNRVE